MIEQEKSAKWPTVRLKYLCKVNPFSPRVPNEQDVTFLPMEAVRECGGIDTSQTRPAGQVKQGYTGFAEGDVLVAKITPCFENGKGSLAVGLKGGVGFGTTELHVLRASNCDPSWLFYVTQSHPFMMKGQGSMYGAGGQKRVPPDFIKDFEVPAPPIGTQRAIADFLDRKTAAIDALIQKKEKLIELLEEKRAALINQAVTKGLDPNVPMKDSGIPWLGEIPAHWEVTRLSFRYHQQLGKMLNQEAALGLEQRPYLGNKDVQWDEVNVSDLKTMHFSASERIKFELKSGDLLVCEGGIVGRTAIWRGELKECYFQKAIHRLRPRDPNRENARFFFYCIRGAEERGLFDEHGEKATIGHLTGEALRAHRFPFPPRMEQRAIANCLDNSIGAMNRAKSVVTRQIQLLKEFRQSLITMAVVGRLAMPSIQELSPVKVVESQEHS